MNINEAFSSDESKEIYDKFLAIVNSRRDNLVKKYGKEAERVAYASAVNQVKKKATNGTEEPTIEEPMDQEQKLKEMIQAALSKPLHEKKKSFPDLTGDGKVTTADILKAKGVELDEDLDLGHQDDEPHMLKSDLYNIGKYAMDLYKMMDRFEGEQEVDLPHWWQAKIIKAKELLDSAKHYLEFETKEPQIDAVVTAASEEGALNEKITKATPAGEVVDDFYKSKAPQFKGKSKEKKRKMAIAAYLSKHPEKVKEAVIKHLKDKK
jgi:hypothetical protein